MIAPRALSVRASSFLALAALLLGPAGVQAQATKTAPATKPQEKAKAKEAPKAKAADPVDLNSATVEELMTLPGVGEAFAAKIVDGRPHKTVDDLDKAGLSAAAIARIKPLAVVRPLPSPVDVNADSVERLQTLPGVGPALAKAIADGRPYKTMDDLAKVKGLGEAKLGTLKGRVAFGTTTAKAATPKEKAEPKAKGEPKAKMEKAEPKAKVAAKDEEEPATTKPKVTLPAGKKVNINKATAEELDGLFGIGPARAQGIIAGRPYEKIEDVMKVKGIKDATFEKMKDAITVK